MPRSVQRCLEVSRGVQRCSRVVQRCLEESRYMGLEVQQGCSKVPAGVLRLCLETDLPTVLQSVF